MYELIINHKNCLTKDEEEKIKYIDKFKHYIFDSIELNFTKPILNENSYYGNIKLIKFDESFEHEIVIENLRINSVVYDNLIFEIKELITKKEVKIIEIDNYHVYDIS